MTNPLAAKNGQAEISDRSIANGCLAEILRPEGLRMTFLMPYLVSIGRCPPTIRPTTVGVSKADKTIGHKEAEAVALVPENVVLPVALLEHRGLAA